MKQKDEVFELILRSWLDLAESVVRTSQKVTEEQRDKIMNMVHQVADIYRDMYKEAK